MDTRSRSDTTDTELSQYASTESLSDSDSEHSSLPEDDKSEDDESDTPDDQIGTLELSSHAPFVPRMQCLADAVPGKMSAAKKKHLLINSHKMKRALCHNDCCVVGTCLQRESTERLMEFRKTFLQKSKSEQRDVLLQHLEGMMITK